MRGIDRLAGSSRKRACVAVAVFYTSATPYAGQAGPFILAPVPSRLPVVERRALWGRRRPWRVRDEKHWSAHLGCERRDDRDGRTSAVDQPGGGDKNRCRDEGRH